MNYTKYFFSSQVFLLHFSVLYVFSWKVNKIMYEIFAKLMEDHNVTSYRVAKDTGVSQTTLSDWKRGRSVPKLEKLKKLAWS